MTAVKWVAAVVGAGLVATVIAGAVTLHGKPEDVSVVAEDARTQYPIVLAHGMAGFAYLGSFSYWNGIPERLRAHGAQVFVTQVSALNSSDLRGQQLLTQVEQIVAETGAHKVNLIGHSHGSMSIRYVAAMRPDLVASVTSVAGPVTGSDTADWVAELSQSHPWAANVLLSMGNGLGEAISWASDKALPQDARATMLSLGSRGAGDFNRRFPAGVPETYCGEGAHEVNGVRFYSWSGVGAFYRAANPSDYLMTLTHQAFKSGPSDGLVGQCASHLGEVIRDDYPMNHFHAINLFWGVVGTDVDPVQLYVDHAHRLKQAGL